MKTKLFKLICFGICSLVILMLVACSVTTITRIEFTKTPNPVYYITAGETGKVDATVKISYSNGTYNESSLDKAANFGVTVTGNTFSSVGNYTLVVTYGAIKASFDYTVAYVNNDPNFTEGDGTVQFPYLISTEAQLKLICGVDYKGKSFKLKNNISLSGNWETLSGSFTGTLDGNGFSIQNLTANQGSEAEFSLFSRIEGTSDLTRAVIRNLTIEMNMPALSASKQASALASSVKNATIADVVVTGAIHGEKVAGFAYSLESNVTIENCTNGANLFVNINASESIIGGIVANVVSLSKNIQFNNVKNQGNITDTPNSFGRTTAGQMIGFIEDGLEDGLNNNFTEVTISNCEGTGIITGNKGENSAIEGDFYGIAYGYESDGLKKYGNTVDSSKFIGRVNNYRTVRVIDPSNEYQFTAREYFAQLYPILVSKSGEFSGVIYYKNGDYDQYYRVAYIYSDNTFFVQRVYYTTGSDENPVIDRYNVYTHSTGGFTLYRNVLCAYFNWVSGTTNFEVGGFYFPLASGGNLNTAVSAAIEVNGHNVAFPHLFNINQDSSYNPFA